MKYVKLEPTNKSLTYFSSNSWQREFSLAVLERYLKGVPNTPKGKKRLQEELMNYPELDPTLVFYNGSVIPRWAIIDFYAITRQEYGLKEKIFVEGNLKGLPTLEEVLGNPGSTAGPASHGNTAYSAK